MIKIKLDVTNEEEVIKWLQKIRRGTGDARPLWLATIPKINEFVQHEFNETQDAHKKWPSLNAKYRDWKIKKGFFPGIGTMTGLLKEGASYQAKKKIGSKELVWELNQGIVLSKKGYPYADVFDKGKKDGSQPPRPIYKYTQLRLNSFLKLDAKKFNSGKVHANFTYKWLKNSLEGYKK